jgi:hypothetical protein
LAAYTDFDVLPVSTATFGIETVSITRPDTYERLEKRYQGDAKVYEYLCELFPDKFPFSEEEWEQYTYDRLLALAYKKNDFYGAKKYGELCKKKTVKVVCSQSKLLFNLFLMLKGLKSK